jgi:hypothetical protein
MAELKIKVRLSELKSLDDQYERQAENLETHEVERLIDQHSREVDLLKQEVVSLRREQIANGRQLVKKAATKKVDGDYIVKIDKLSNDINQIKMKTEEENKRLEKIVDNMDNLRSLVEEEKLKYLELRQKHEIDIDFDELTDKNLEVAEKKYWKLIAKKTSIEDYMKAIENTTGR